MEHTVAEYIQICEWDPAKFLIFSDNVFNNLIYYSHLLPLVVALILALFVFFNNRRLLASRWLLITSVLLAVWLFFDLILWATEKPVFTLFFWSIVNMIEPMIYAGILFFMYAFIDGKNLSFSKNAFVLTLILPTVILASTSLNLSVYDLSNCDREAIEGILPYYSYFIEAIFAFWILGFGIRRFINLSNRAQKTKVALITTAAVFFLLSFAMGNVLGSLLVNWEIGQYGLFGIPVFIAMLSYLIVKYHAFDVKVIGAQLLVVALWILTFAILFLQEVGIIQKVVLVTLVLFTALGYLLIRSVKREVKQREALAIANAGQENLIHIMNHQIKGYLAKGRNIFAEMLEDREYGLTEKARPMVDEGMKSLTEGVEFVQQVLRGSSAESGKLEYSMKPLDFRQVAEKAYQEMQNAAKAKGLELNLAGEGEFKMVGDEIQLREAVKNFISNSVAYTEHGSVDINIKKSGGKVVLSVRDTGIGMNKEDMSKLFQKGGRGKDSLKYNASSTGYGLAFTKAVVEAHKGHVWAESAGLGKGSTFYMELQLS